MKRTTLLLFCFSVSLCFLKAQKFSGNARSTGQVVYKENKGQISDQDFRPRPDVLFSATDGRIQLFLKATGISYQLDKVDSWTTQEVPVYLLAFQRKGKKVPAQRTICRLDINWLNASPDPEIIKGELQPGFENYYGESCPGGALSVRSYADLIYKEIYPGIDLKWYAKDGALEYDFYVKPFADHKKISLEYKGSEKLSVNRNGELVIQTPLGSIIEKKPMVTQGGRQLAAEWVIKGNTAAFDISHVDPSLPMIIDPMVRLWGTYYGGSADDYAYSISTDNAANVYLAGWTQSASNIATTGAYQTVYSGAGASIGDAFLVKFDAAGVRQWATYYGGAEDDYASRAMADNNGDIYMIGGTSTTNSAVMATPGSHQSTAPGSTSTMTPNDAFLVKFNASGVRQWGTYYGGSKSEWGGNIGIDASGDIVISGSTNSTDGTSIATPGCQQPLFGGGACDCFLARFSPAGVRQWGTYYGGSGQQDVSNWCSFTASGDIYMTGYTTSSNGISTPGSHQPTWGGNYDGFVVKFNASGMRQWGTYYGGPGIDYMGYSLADASGNLYICGCTSGSSTAISTPGCHQFNYGGGAQDGLFAKFDAAGVRQWGTYYGGPGFEYGGAPAFDASGNIYFSGTTSTSSGTGIATACAYNYIYNGGSSDVYLEKFTPAGTRLWGTYFGSIYSDECYGSATDTHGGVYLMGVTLANSGTVMATQGAHQTTYGGLTEIFLEKFDGCIPSNPVNQTPPANLLVCAGQSATLSASCGYWYTSATGTSIIANGGTFVTGPITSDSTFYVEDFACGVVSSNRAAISVSLHPSFLSVSNSNTSSCVGEIANLTASGASSYTWTGPFTSSTTAVFPVYILLNTVYTVTAIENSGCESTRTVAITSNLCSGMAENEMSDNHFMVYPNPNAGNVSIRSLSELELSLVNELGQKVRTLRLSADNNFTVQLQGLRDGVYFLAGTKDGTAAVRKIVVMQ